MDFEAAQTPASKCAAHTAAISGNFSGAIPAKRIRPLRRPARLDKRSGAWKRICELKAVYSSGLGDRPLTPLLEARISEAAHLMATAEIARARFLKGEAGVRIDAVATVERLARDAVKALRLADAPSKPAGSSAIERLRSHMAEISRHDT
jgi:hypothetical protein